MTVPSRERERRDWTLIIFLIPLGIILIIIVGQLAIRMFPNWVINADMRSNLDPNSAPGQPASLLQPLLPQILTPMAWAESYLTPGAGGDVSFPPFIVLEPTNTPTATPSPTIPSPTATTPSPTSTFTPTPTSTSGGGGTGTPTTPPPPTICEDPAATNYLGPLPCTYPTPPTICEDPAATNYLGPLPCVYPTPPTICEDPAATNYLGPLPCVYPTPTGYPSTPDPTWTLISPVPPEVNTDVPDNNPVDLDNGNFFVLDVSSNPVVVSLTPDNYYDLVFYEYNSWGVIYMDHIIIGVSQNSDGSIYYEVFNWGDDIPDTNTNADVTTLPPSPLCVPNQECDNYEIDPANLYPNPGTGILIDVDTATSQPPPGTYNYVVVISPATGTGDPSQIDAIIVTEVPLPTPTP